MWPERATVNSSSSVPAQLSMTGADRPVAGGARRRPVPPPVLVPEPVVAGGGTGGGTSAAKGAPVPLAGGETVGLVVARPDDEESVGAGAAGRDETAAPTWNLLTREMGRRESDTGHGRARGSGLATSGSVDDHVGSSVDDGRGDWAAVSRRSPAPLTGSRVPSAGYP